MMTTKTYAVYGLIEYEVALKIGDKVVKAHFTGGSITAQGIIPAKYTTSNPVVQYKLEQHAGYKSGRVRIDKEVVSEEPVKAEPRQSQAEAPEAKEPETPEDTGEDTPEETGEETPTLASWEDAADYISEKYGIPKRQLRTKGAVEAAAKQYGVRYE